MRTALSPNSLKLALALAATLLVAACAPDAGRLAGVDGGDNVRASAYSGFR